MSAEKSTHIGTREGAVRGLVGVGKEAVRKGLVEGGGARVIGNEVSSGLPGGDGLATVVMVCSAEFVSDAVRCLKSIAGCARHHEANRPGRPDGHAGDPDSGHGARGTADFEDWRALRKASAG